MDGRSHFLTLARYNSWANHRLYTACAALSDDERRADRGCFFKSIHDTLNHLLVVDRLWFGRFEGVDHGVRYLAETLYEDFDPLWGAREDFDAHIERLVEGLPPAWLERPLVWTSSKGQRFSGPGHLLLAHAFNHQTHHRGQVHAMLTQAGTSVPPLDLWFYMVDAGDAGLADT